MQAIYWTYKQIKTKHSVMILYEPPNSSLCFNLSIDENGCAYSSFNTFEQAKQFVLELNKPVYAKEFGAGYELIFLENDSDKWYELFDKWDYTNEVLKVAEKYFTLPLYQFVCIALWEKAKSFVKKLFAC